MAPDVLAAVATVPLFQTLSPQEFQEMAGLFEHDQIPAGTWIFRENDAADALYVVVEGKVDVSKSSDGAEHVLARLGNGAVLGEMALLTAPPRSASVRAVSDCTVVRLPRAPFQALLGKDSVPALKVGARIADVLARRLSLMNEKTLEMARKLEGNKREDLQDFHRILQAWHL